MVSIKTLWTEISADSPVHVQGWVKTKRISKHVAFITIQDGSCMAPLQVVANPTNFKEDLLKRLTVGASLSIKGRLVSSPGEGQSKEVQADTIEVLGDASAAYPLQPKRHSLAFLRTIQHLRMRTSTFAAIFRVRHVLGYAIHTFFHERGFYWLHTPIITSVDAEGAGEVFRVTSDTESGARDFFGEKVSLTVSGQLAGEAGVMGLNKIYTFGPTFRAENSNTTRHLAEFWMVEPEMAFYELPATIALAEELIRYVVRYLLAHCEKEMALLEQRAQREAGEPSPVPLRERLAKLGDADFIHITYTDAVALLEKANGQEPFAHPIAWGKDLQTEHERSLIAHLGGPVVVTDYPKALKAFYMRQNADGKTVAAMDLLLPDLGEVIGGSQREERLINLEAAMECKGIDQAAMAWYLDTRRFGTVPHSGFGLGFERLLAFVTGMKNIRDVIPFPRTPGHAVC